MVYYLCFRNLMKLLILQGFKKWAPKIYGLLWTIMDFGLFLKFVIGLLYVALRGRGGGRGVVVESSR